jgi:pyruvate/2-oxoacid:ferredoxin oxidoreductase alpha subunit
VQVKELAHNASGYRNQHDVSSSSSSSSSVAAVKDESRDRLVPVFAIAAKLPITRHPNKVTPPPSIDTADSNYHYYQPQNHHYDHPSPDTAAATAAPDVTRDTIESDPSLTPRQRKFLLRILDEMRNLA